MENPDMKCIVSIVSSETVTVSREKYDELIRARMAIDTIGASDTKYGFDSDVIRAVLKIFGYEHKEDGNA